MVGPVRASYGGAVADPIELVDLRSQQARLRPALEEAIAAVLDHGAYVDGPEVDALEAELARRSGAHHAISCASGTHALLLVLLAWGVGPGDAVVVPSLTFAATAEAVVLAGALPVFADVDAVAGAIDARSVAAVLDERAARGIAPPVGAISVDLHGLPVDVAPVAHELAPTGGWVLSDAAQSFGASIGGVPVGSSVDGRATTTSFFPAKPLGAYGDGGAVFVDDAETATTVRSLRHHGQGADRFEHVRVGITGRLDTIQAAVLLQKLTIFDDELAARERIARRYLHQLGPVVADVGPDRLALPVVPEGCTSSWAQFAVQVAERDRVSGALGADGVPTGRHYPHALVDQPAFARCPDPTGSPVARRVAARTLSLPMHPYLTEAQQDDVVTSLARAVRAGGAGPG